METIVNKVASSGLVNFDLESLISKETVKEIDISNWLWQGLVVKEKKFKEHLGNHNWTQYENALVHISCSGDAIVPNWAYMMLVKNLSGIAKFVSLGSERQLFDAFITIQINNLDLSTFKDARVLVKGCSEKEVSSNAYVLLTQKLLPVVKSLMFGEACSNVPIYKSKVNK